MEKTMKKNTIELAEQIAAEGIKVYTVGVGTEKGAPIPMKTNGRLIGYKKDRQGEVVITQRHSEILKDVAGQSRWVLC